MICSSPKKQLEQPAADLGSALARPVFKWSVGMLKKWLKSALLALLHFKTSKWSRLEQVERRWISGGVDRALHYLYCAAERKGWWSNRPDLGNALNRSGAKPRFSLKIPAIPALLTPRHFNPSQAAVG